MKRKRPIQSLDYARRCIRSLESRWQSTRDLLDKVYPHHKLLAAIVAGVARWEFFHGSTTAGEVCVGGIRYSTTLDHYECPILSNTIERALDDAMRQAGKAATHA